MSLINQVLNDLKKRGSGVSDTASLIRPVAAPSRWKRKAAWAAGLAMLAGAAAGALWSLLDDSAPTSPQDMSVQRAPRPASHPAPSQAMLAASQPASAVSQSAFAASQPVYAASQAVAAVQGQSAAAAASSVQEAHERETLPLRLSVELASQPAPATPASSPAIAKAEGSPSGHKPAVHKPAKKSPAHPPMVPAATAATATARENSSIKRMSPQQQAEGEFSQASDLAQQGRGDEAKRHLESALQLNPSHAQARLLLASLLLGGKHNAEAESVLQEGLRIDPTQPRLSMLLARIQVEHGSLAQAQETLQKTLPYAEGQADYQAFLAAVLQRQNLHEEAVRHYQAALQQSPNAGVWWMGMGISLQALKRDAFTHALDSGSLSAELQDFVKQKMKAL